MKNDTRIQFVVSNTQPKEPGFQGDLPCPRESPWKPGSFGVCQTTTFHFHF